MTEDDFKRIENMMAHHVGVAMEDAQHKFDLLIEGHQMLSERMDRMESRMDSRMDSLEAKIDGVATDLAAHRADTEAHRGVYGVREE